MSNGNSRVWESSLRWRWITVGSCLTSALVDFTCSLHTATSICVIGYNQTTHFMHPLFTQQIYTECFSNAMTCACTELGSRHAWGRACVYLIYLCFSSTQQNGWHTECVQKHLLLNSIIIVPGTIISVQPLATTQREAGRA